MPKVLLPRTLDEIWPILDGEPDAALYAGGTDLLVKLRSGAVKCPLLVCIERVEELRGVRDRGEAVFIAAANTHTRLLEDNVVQAEFPLLVQALRVLGSPPIRNMGTIGGNIVTASPAGDTLPPLYVLGAEVEVRSNDGARRLPLRDFVLGPGRVALEKGELLSGIWLKKHRDWSIQLYEKVGRRKALACSVVNMAALLRTAQDGTVLDARLAWGSVAPTVVISRSVEQALVGKPLSPETLRTAGALVQDAIQPIDDLRASAEYRRLVAGALLLRLLDLRNREVLSTSTVLRSG
jgi:xanthine dehydrogenase FAD-binding subunit